MIPNSDLHRHPPALHRASEVNPYTRWIHEYPAVLLAAPTPSALREKMEASPAASGPLVLDLGCGSGNFLLQMASLLPRRRFVGFELRYKRLVKAARKIEKAKLKNVWLLREAAERFALYCAPASLAEVHVNFPDPWPKRRDWTRRLVSVPFLHELERTLQHGGLVHLRTDHSGYFLHVLSLLKQLDRLRPRVCRNDDLRRRIPGSNVRSEFEQMFSCQQKPIFYLVLENSRPTR